MSVGLSARFENRQKVVYCKGYIITGISQNIFGMFQGWFKGVSRVGPLELEDKVKPSKSFVTLPKFLMSEKSF